MKKACIIQARMQSRRLPGKVLKDVAGKPMLAQQIQRLRRCELFDNILVATSFLAVDDPIVDIARKEDVAWFRGSEEDVLARFVDAARQVGADVIVRITADCPLIDPQIADRVVDELVQHISECDYAANVLQRTYPRGLDVEAFFWDTLLRIDRLARSQQAREHVTIVPRSERPELFMCRSVIDTQDNSDLRWTVDTEADLQVVRVLYEKLGLHERSVTYSELLAYVREHPELTKLNADIETWSPQ